MKYSLKIDVPYGLILPDIDPGSFDLGPIVGDIGPSGQKRDYRDLSSFRPRKKQGIPYIPGNICREVVDSTEADSDICSNSPQ